MTYSGADQASEARGSLGKALAALQEDANIPDDVMAVAQNIAQAVGALFEAENASSEPDGKASVRSAMGTLGQTLALLQDVRSQHDGIQVATEVIAKAMSTLYPLTTKASQAPPAQAGTAAPEAPGPAAVPAEARQVAQAPAPAAGPTPPVVESTGGPRQDLEVNVGATTESNFFVGFSGEVGEGGVFVATYEVHPRGTPIHMLVTLPGGFQFQTDGIVRFVRDPLDFSADAEPGMGVQFAQLDAKHRELVLRFIRKRPPMFYDE
jgi:uncharacterized protein (TIGR02266 family)